MIEERFEENHFRYIVVWKKGYQQVQEPRGTSVIKVKGVAKVNGSETLFMNDANEYIWDVAEYEIPPIVSGEDLSGGRN